MGLLSLSIWVPIAFGALLLLFGREGQANLVRWLALIGSLVGLAVSIPLITGFDTSTALMQFELDAWVLRDEITHHQWQRVTRLGMRSSQHQSPGIAGSKLGAGTFQILGFTQNAFGNIEHHLTRLGDARKPLATSFENRYPQFILQQLHLLGDTGLRGEKGFRRLGNIKPLTLNFDDITQLLKFHDST